MHAICIDDKKINNKKKTQMAPLQSPTYLNEKFHRKTPDFIVIYIYMYIYICVCVHILFYFFLKKTGSNL